MHNQCVTVSFDNKNNEICVIIYRKQDVSMYKKIEELYKKKSPYNKIKIKMFWTYIVIALFLSLFNFFNSYVLMILTVILTIIRMKYICEKELNTKLFKNKEKL